MFVQKNSAKLSSALFTGVLGKSPSREIAKFPYLRFNKKQMDFGCLVTSSIRETFSDQLKGDSLSVLLNLRPQDQTIDVDGPSQMTYPC